MLALTFLASVLWLSATALADRIFTIRNRCPQSITLYINGQTQGLLAMNGFMNQTFEDSWSGLIYTDANGGNANGAGTTKAGFYGQVTIPLHFSFAFSNNRSRRTITISSRMQNCSILVSALPLKSSSMTQCVGYLITDDSLPHDTPPVDVILQLDKVRQHRVQGCL